MAEAVRIALVFPSLLGTYGDGGNAVVLARRLSWRGIESEVVEVEIGQALPEAADLYVLGGGEDAAQTLAVSQLSDGSLGRVVDAGQVVFAVCAGFQILGETFLDGSGKVNPGLGLIDCHTDRLAGSRAVGELLGASTIDGMGELTGYENHGGRTTLGPDAAPLATVIHGIGNGASAQAGIGPAATGAFVDGAMQGSVIATYLHGPALARNPKLADWILARVVGDDLSEIDDREELELRRERLSAVKVSGLRRRFRSRQWRPSAIS